MNQKPNEYQVLSRKYRPQKLSELIGQDMLVQTLTNAIEAGRIPHAFVMTGIRGVGKTSTARIIARSLICSGAEGKNEAPTITPCGVCENCKAIAEDRHVDVLEMDAASRTGVGDIREIIDNVHYHPVMARYKIYIIDEVHMLSKSAFNALLKTLEEPPAHAKFIFATTEIRKIPVTILSRCMRFDLPRVSVEELSTHLANIADKEGAKIAAGALAQIAKAAEGSVRDSLSLLDQSIGTSLGEEISVAQIRKMLGVADRGNLFDLFEHIAKGDIEAAIESLRSAYNAGSDPVVILQDLLEITHFITKLKVIKDFSDSKQIAQDERERGIILADKLSISFLARLWQMLLKGIAEADLAKNSLIAAEMILVRIAYASDMPSPDDLIKKIKAEGASSSPSSGSQVKPKQTEMAGAEAQKKTLNIESEACNNPSNFNELVELFEVKGEYFQAGMLREISLINFDAKAHRFEFNPAPSLPASFAGEVSDKLSNWTGKRWFAVVSNAKGAASLRQKSDNKLDERKEIAKNDERVQALLAAFATSFISNIEEVVCDELIIEEFIEAKGSEL